MLKQLEYASDLGRTCDKTMFHDRGDAFQHVFDMLLMLITTGVATLSLHRQFDMLIFHLLILFRSLCHINKEYEYFVYSAEMLD